MNLEYTWKIVGTAPNLKIENETAVVFGYTGTNPSGVSWTYFGVKSFATSDTSEILEQLSKINEIEMMKIKIQQKIKKILNPENYATTN